MVPTDGQKSKRDQKENILPLEMTQNRIQGNIHQAKLLFLREPNWLDYTKYDKEKRVLLANWRKGSIEFKYSVFPILQTERRERKRAA